MCTLSCETDGYEVSVLHGDGNKPIVWNMEPQRKLLVGCCFAIACDYRWQTTCNI